jgi:hypothetical protein
MAQRLSAMGEGIATLMSGLRSQIARRSRAFMALARLSLVAATAMLSGCLIDDPPPYPEPKQTPPRLDYATAIPALNQIIIAKRGDPLSFKVFASSEDAGDGLNAFLLLDYNGSAIDLLGDDFLLPSTLDDTSRFFEIPWEVRSNIPGCHRITLRVAHTRNLPDSHTPVVNAADLAEAYWWLQVDPDPSDAGNLVDCPTAMESK